MGSLTVPLMAAGITDDPATAVRPSGRLAYDADRGVLRVFDGTTPGGRPVGGEAIRLKPRGSGLSDLAAINQGFADALATGRPLEMIGSFLVNGTPEINLATVPKVNLIVSGYGASLKASGSGATCLMRILRGVTPYGITIQGLSFDVAGNTELLAGFEAARTTHLRLADLAFETGAGNANFDAIYLHPTDNLNGDTASFWTSIENVHLRPNISGTRPRSAIHLQGEINATTIFGGSFQAVVDAVLLDTLNPTGAVANGVLILGTHFEGITGNAVRTVCNAANPASGLRLIGNRLESTPTVLSLEGATAQPAVPTYLAGNYIIGSGTTYINNPNNLLYTSVDASITPGVSPTTTAPRGMTVRGYDPAFDALKVHAPNVGSGIGLYDFFGNNLWSLRYRAGSGVIATTSGGQLAYHTKALTSSSTVEVRNTQNVIAFSAQTTRSVVFANAEADASYGVTLMPQGGAPIACTFNNATTAGFDIVFASAFTGTVFWKVSR